MLFFAFLPPVSYSQDVAPILALHCNTCHGGSAGLSTRSHADLLRGGNSGPAIIPGDADKSLLMQFIDGRRGERRRMPLGGAPLTDTQIDLIRRWIAEGAKEDAVELPVYRSALPDTTVDRRKPLRIFCRVNTQSYLTLIVRDRRDGEPLFTDVASLKSPKRPGDAGEPGALISWDVRAGINWPKTVDIELLIEYTEAEPQNTEFYTRFVDP